MAITNLNLASDLPILNALVRLKGNSYSLSNSWVANNNRYLTNTISIVKSDIASGTLNDQDITEYIAASALIHCSNSWSYLSSAINSYIEGDYGTAVHNAYYSELRSLMSFLASQGVGVFSGQHIIVDATGKALRAAFNNGEQNTHTFAKVAFDQWLNDNSNTNRLLQLLKVRDYPLENWLNNAGFSSQLAGLNSADLFRKWSVDVNILEQEHNLRNFVSYRPQNYDINVVRSSDDLRLRIQTILDMWDICGPNKLFEVLILRKTLDDLNTNQFGKKFYQEGDPKIQQLLTDMGLNSLDNSGNYLFRFLKHEINSPDNALLNYAINQISNPVVEQDTEPSGILSRACLLLLSVTNIMSSVLHKTSTSRSDLDFWHNNIGIKHGYWAPGDEPLFFAELWGEIEEEINAIKAWLDLQGPNPNVHSFKNDLKENSSVIRHINKSYFWYTFS